MAVDQVVATMNALLKDPTKGLAANVATLLLARELPPDRVRTDFTFDEWLVSGKMRPADAPRITVRPQRLIANQIAFVGNTRRSDVALEVQLRYFATDEIEIELAGMLTATALMMAIDGVEAYSRATGGTIMAFRDPISFDVGTYDGPPTSGGWLAAFTVLEDSPQ